MPNVAPRGVSEAKQHYAARLRAVSGCAGASVRGVLLHPASEARQRRLMPSYARLIDAFEAPRKCAAQRAAMSLQNARKLFPSAYYALCTKRFRCLSPTPDSAMLSASPQAFYACVFMSCRAAMLACAWSVGRGEGRESAE